MGKFHSVNTDLTAGLVLLLCGRAAEKGGYRKVFFHLQKAVNTIPWGNCIFKYNLKSWKVEAFLTFSKETFLITGQVVCVLLSSSEVVFRW